MLVLAVFVERTISRRYLLINRCPKEAVEIYMKNFFRCFSDLLQLSFDMEKKFKSIIYTVVENFKNENHLK